MLQEDKNAQQERFKKILAKLREKSPTCFDCNAKNPAWGSIHFGILVCFDCAGSHRQMGTHISFVRSTVFDGWSELHLKKMMIGGNARAAAYFRKYGLKTGNKNKCFTDFYDSKVAQRYKLLITEDAKKAVVPGSPVKTPSSPTQDLDDILGSLKIAQGASLPAPTPLSTVRTATIPAKTPERSSSASSKASPSSRAARRKEEELAKFANNMVVKSKKTTKKKVVKKKPKPAAKPAARRRRGGGPSLVVADDGESSSDFDESDEPSKPPSTKKKQQPAKPATSQAQKQGNDAKNPNVSAHVKDVFAKKYGTKVRGGEKKMTSIGSDDFFHADPAQEEHRNQMFSNSKAIGSDAYFGREEEAPKKTAGSEINWDDIRDEASQKMEKLTQAASGWFSSLKDTINNR